MYKTVLISRLRFILTIVLGISFLFLIPLFDLKKILPDIVLFVYILVFMLGPVMLALRICQYRKDIVITDDLIKVGEFEFYWEDIKTYKLEYSNHMETLTIRLENNKTIYLTGFVDGKKSREFQLMKKRFLQRLARYNHTVDDRDIIKRTGFFESKYAKLIGFVIIGVILLVTIFLFTGRIDKPYPVFMLMAVSTPVLLQIFRKRNRS